MSFHSVLVTAGLRKCSTPKKLGPSCFWPVVNKHNVYSWFVFIVDCFPLVLFAVECFVSRTARILLVTRWCVSLRSDPVWLTWFSLSVLLSVYLLLARGISAQNYFVLSQEMHSYAPFVPFWSRCEMSVLSYCVHACDRGTPEKDYPTASTVIRKQMRHNSYHCEYLCATGIQ